MTLRNVALRAHGPSPWLFAGVAVCLAALAPGIGSAAIPPGHPAVAETTTPAPPGPSMSRVALQGLVYLELGDDALGVTVFFQIYNLGQAVWTPTNVAIGLPQNYRAFRSETDSSKPGFNEVVGQGAVFRGSFPPGQHEAQFHFKIPYSSDGSQSFSISLPPYVGRLRVMSEAAAGMHLAVPGFTEPVAEPDRSGRLLLSTDRELAPGEPPFERLAIELNHIPTATRGGLWLGALTAAIMLSGVLLAYRTRRNRASAMDLDLARSRLVDEIAALHDARARGIIGSAGYDRLHRLLLDALGRILGRIET